MNVLSKFEGKMEDVLEGSMDVMFDAPISPVQIAKKAEKQMKREKMVGAGKQYAPTLYTVLVNPDDDQRLFGYYPTLAGETETYLAAKASEQGLAMDGQPLVRFIVDDGLRHGKFEVIAEAVAAPIVAQLRAEEMQRYGIGGSGAAGAQSYSAGAAQPYGAGAYGAGAAAGAAGAYGGYGQAGANGAYAPAGQAGQPGQAGKPPLPYVPEDELDYSIDYGEYTFDSHDFEGGYDTPAGAAGAAAAGAAAGAVEEPDTVVFAGGSQGADANPDRNAVQARLVDVTNNRTYDLASTRLTIGRESKNDISIHDINASRQHAELRLDPQGVWFITDLGSTNGTKVNDRAVASQMLRDGDRITIGVTNFVFHQA